MVGLLSGRYMDPVEIVTAPVPAQSPFIPPTPDRGRSGRCGPPDPIPIVLLPGFEYRMREWGPDTHEMHWRLERKGPLATETTTSST